MRRKKYPILEFDPASEAVIEPRRVIRPAHVPEHCVVCFFHEVLRRLRRQGRTRALARLSSEDGTRPVYEVRLRGKRLAVYHPGIGAPFAAASLEELVALGCRKFIACGGAGVLRRDIAAGHVIVPTSAIRDEGTSYHYLAPGPEAKASPRALKAIEAVLKRHQCRYVVGKTWTTDAFYRETHEKVRMRRAEGCLTVEMEAAAFFAVAKFRKVPFAQILYGGDDVSGMDWDPRGWDSRESARERLFWLAAEACLFL
jgi:uridine phosphorylase